MARDLADTTSGGLTATNMTVGTAAYAAPEQLMGLAMDGRTDQYSLAATAYHLLTGTPPFTHTNPAVVIGQHLNATPPVLASTRPELESFDAALSRALAKDPQERFPTCTDFAHALQHPEAAPVQPTTARVPGLAEADTQLRDTANPVVAGSGPVSVDYSDPPSPPGRPLGHRWGRVALAGAAFLVVVGVIAYLAVRPSSDPSVAEPFTLAGTLRLSSAATTTAKNLPGGYACAGAHDYGDVGPAAPVLVEDESGKLLAKGAIDASSSAHNECALKFQVDDVPAGAHFYRVKVAQHPEMSYTESEAKTGVDFTLGDTDPAHRLRQQQHPPRQLRNRPAPPTTLWLWMPKPRVWFGCNRSRIKTAPTWRRTSLTRGYRRSVPSAKDCKRKASHGTT